MFEIHGQLNDFVRSTAPDIPLPGSGDTWRRFTALAEQASIDLSLGRLCEGHVDALSILADAGRKPAEGAAYGVWASRSINSPTMARRVPGGWLLSGSKSFCCGSGFVDRALVVAETNDGRIMFDVPVNEHVVAVVPHSCASTGMEVMHGETLVFGGPLINDDDVVGPTDFYSLRPGFWFGALGVAACWYGGAVGLVNDLIKSLSPVPSDVVLADLGECVSALEAMRVTLKCCAHSIDRDPRDEAGQAHLRTLVARQVLHASALRVLERVASVSSAGPHRLDRAHSPRVADLFAYLSRHHVRADVKELGRMLAKVA